MSEELNKATLKLFLKLYNSQNKQEKKIMQRAIPMMIPNRSFVSIRQDIAKLNFKVTISFKLFLVSINIASMERTIVYRVQNTDFYFTSTCSS